MLRNIVIVLALLLLTAAPVSADTARGSEAVTFASDTSFGRVGTFTASGGTLCAAGTTSDGPVRVTEGRRSAALTFHLERTFICDDGSGTWTVRIQAHVQPCDENDYGSWVVTGGTGAYTALRGAGQLIGTYYPGDACNAEGIVDEFSGRMVAP